MRKLIDSAKDSASTQVVHTSVKHESAARQVQGSAKYIDDLVEPQGTLYAAVGTTRCAAGIIESIDLSAVSASEEIGRAHV